MKEKSGLILLSSAVVLSCFLTSFRAPDRQVEEREPRLITVTGDAVVKVVPDEVVITLGIETYHEELSVAKRRNDDQVRRVILVAERHGIESKHIQTDYISIDPRYKDSYWRYDIEGYVVRKTMVITLRDISRFDELLTDVIEEGVNYVHGIDFRTTELRKHRDQARSLAVVAAREKAEAMTGDLGQELGEPQTIQEIQVGWWSWYGYGWWGYRTTVMSQNVVQNAGDMPPGVEGSVAPGQISVNARVSVTFEMQ